MIDLRLNFNLSVSIVDKEKNHILIQSSVFNCCFCICYVVSMYLSLLLSPLLNSWFQFELPSGSLAFTCKCMSNHGKTRNLFLSMVTRGLATTLILIGCRVRSPLYTCALFHWENVSHHTPSYICLHNEII